MGLKQLRGYVGDGVGAAMLEVLIEEAETGLANVKRRLIQQRKTQRSSRPRRMQRSIGLACSAIQSNPCDVTAFVNRKPVFIHFAIL